LWVGGQNSYIRTKLKAFTESLSTRTQTWMLRTRTMTRTRAQGLGLVTSGLGLIGLDYITASYKNIKLSRKVHTALFVRTIKQEAKVLWQRLHRMRFLSAPPSNTVFLWPKSIHPKHDLNPFSRFCTPKSSEAM